MILSTVISPVLAASQQQNDLLSRIFVFDRYSELVQLLQNSILAGAVLGIIGGFRRHVCYDARSCLRRARCI